jgi:formylglycine-generating enzyme required for sulfatase activity
LARRNALEIGARFHPDVDRLIEVLEKVLAAKSSKARRVEEKQAEPVQETPSASSKAKEPIVTAPPEPKPAAPTRRPFEPEMILIPAGEFLMGSDPTQDNSAGKDEQPQHTLYLPIFYIAKTPVTEAQYATFVQVANYQSPRHWKTKQPPADRQDHPVVNVSWHDAVAYCRWLAEDTGKPYRLPTEAEWEKAARGPDGRIYPWGNQWDKNRCNTLGKGKGGTTPVGVYRDGVSPYGLLDMAGNVWEWCATRRQKTYPYDNSEDEWSADYLGGTDVRVLRGGSWNNIQYDVRCACRLGELPGYMYDFYGFRVRFSPI